MGGSLKTRLVVLFTLFTCIPVLAGALLSTYFNINEMKEATIASNFSLSKEISNQIKISMEHAESINNAVAIMPVVRSMNVEGMQRAIADVQAKNPQFELIAVLDKDGRQIARTSGKNGDRANRPYFQKAIQGESFLSEAYVSATTQGLCVTFSEPVRDASGAIVGVVASDVSLGYLWDIADRSVIGESGYIDIVDNQGNVLAHPDKEKIRKKENFSSYAYVQAALRGESGALEAVSTVGEDSLISYMPVEKYQWGVVTYEPTHEVYASALRNGAMMAALVVFFLCLGVAAAFRVASGIVAPVQSLVEAAHRIAGGDLSQVVRVQGALEINRLTDEFNEMIKQLRALISKTAEASETVSAASEELAASIGVVGKSAKEISSDVEQTARSTEEKKRLSERSAEVIQTMAREVGEAAGAAQEAAQASGESKAFAGRGFKQSSHAIEKIAGVQRQVNESAQVISALGEKSRRIGAFVDTISGLAGQTNLLALNAAIEAARAGEHGKGFAVVAEEVGKLAEQSETAAGEIAAIIHAIQQETMTAVERMDASCKEVDAGVVAVQETVDALQGIDQAISNVNAQVQRISEISLQQKEGGAAAAEAVQEISAFLSENAANFEQLAEASAGQTAAAQQVEAAANDLARMAMELRSEISRFKV